MHSEVAQLLPILARLEAKLDALQQKPKPHLTRKDFAREAGISARTVKRRIDACLIRTEKGRIPRTELAKFVS